MQSWYEEIDDYHFFGEEPPRDNYHITGHFTQLIWKASERVGVGKAFTTNSLYVVCNYDPPGNVFNRYPANVLAPVETKIAKKVIGDSKPVSSNSNKTNKTNKTNKLAPTNNKATTTNTTTTTTTTTATTKPKVIKK